MFNDPIIEEIQKIRDEYAKSFQYDVDAICQDLINKQNIPEKKLISFPPKLVEPINRLHTRCTPRKAKSSNA